jgi:probable HAF family extracellular repeat protein
MIRRFRFQTLVAVAVVCGFSAFAAAQSPHVYRVDDLGSLGGDLVGVAINSKGDVTGAATLPDGTVHAFRWIEQRGLEDLGANGGRSSGGFAINDQGDVVGVYFDQDWRAHAFVASPGEPMNDLGMLYPQIFQPSIITNDGRFAGSTIYGHAFRTLAGGTLQELSPYVSFGADMNSAGAVTGWGWHDANMVRPQTSFRYSDAHGYVDLGTLGGLTSYGFSINDDGIVVGTSEVIPGRAGHAFRAAPGLPMEDLGGLPGGFAGGISGAYAINQRGEIVGQSDAWYGWTAFVYSDDEGMVDLKSRIPLVERLMRGLHWGRDINNSGQIVVGYDRSTRYGTVRLTPVDTVPAPVASPTVSPSVLTPPNGELVSVSVDPHVTDAYDPEPFCRITSVTNSEHSSSDPDPDVQITDPLSVNLRAARLGYNTGRTYTIDLTCGNYLGRTSVATVVVSVPHDSSKDQ